MIRDDDTPNGVINEGDELTEATVYWRDVFDNTWNSITFQEHANRNNLRASDCAHGLRLAGYIVNLHIDPYVKKYEID